MDYFAKQKERELKAKEAKKKYGRAFFLVGLAAIAGGFGIFMRWAQNMTAYEKDTGLYISTNGWGGVITLLIIAVIGGLGFYVYKYAYLEGLASPKGYRDAFRIESGISETVHRAVWILITLLSFAAALLIYKDADETRYPGMLLVLSVLVFLNSIAFALAAISMKNPAKPLFLRTAFLLPIATVSFWLLYTYRADTVTPAVWRYALEIPALCTSLLGWFFISGYAYGRESDHLTIVFSVTGAFLCIVSIPDDRIIGLNLLYFVNAAQLLLFVFVLAHNMEPYSANAVVVSTRRGKISDRLMGISAEESALERTEAAAFIGYNHGEVTEYSSEATENAEAENEVPQPEEEPELEHIIMDVSSDEEDSEGEDENNRGMFSSDGDKYIEAEPIIILDESGERWREWDFEEAKREQQRQREEDLSDFFIDDDEIF